MSSSNRLPSDPHPRKTKKPWASAAAARLLLLRGVRAAAKDESIEFFSALRLRECNPDPRISGQTGRGPADRKGKARRSAGDSGGGLLVSAEMGKHDYDWLLTPPATRISSPATGGAAAAALNRLARPTSASHAKSNSLPLSVTAQRENRNPTASRLARSSSAPNTPALALASASSPGSGRPSHVRTLSSSAGSSTSTLLAGSAATRPGTPATKDSKARRKPSKVNQGWRTSNSSRPRAPTTGAESTGVTSSETEQRPALPTARRGANAVARSRFATAGSTSTGQTAHNPLRPSSSSIKPRPMPVPVTAGTQRWRRQSPSTSDGTRTHQSASGSRGLAAKRSPRNGGKASVVDKDKPAPPAGLASAGASRKPANNFDAKPRSRADAFPSTRYDAMLLREDLKNLTWLNGCGDDDDEEHGSYGAAGLVEGSLEEPFHVPAGVLK